MDKCLSVKHKALSLALDQETHMLYKLDLFKTGAFER